MWRYDLNSVLPVFWKVANILAVIPATSERLNNLAIMNIERVATNSVLQLQMNQIIDTFGK